MVANLLLEYTSPWLALISLYLALLAYLELNFSVLHSKQTKGGWNRDPDQQSTRKKKKGQHDVWVIRELTSSRACFCLPAFRISTPGAAQNPRDRMLAMQGRWLVNTACALRVIAVAGVDFTVGLDGLSARTVRTVRHTGSRFFAGAHENLDGFCVGLFKFLVQDPRKSFLVQAIDEICISSKSFQRSYLSICSSHF